jgi:hypothetical protein
VLIEDADAPGAATLAIRALRRGSRVLVGVRAARPDLAARRLLDGLPAADRTSASATIAEAITVVLDLPRDGHPGQVLTVDEGTRGSILSSTAGETPAG